MSGEMCTLARGNCNGFFRGAAHKGWAGSKLFVLEFAMPAIAGSDVTPAIWALSGQILRSMQYGACNCRGMGGGIDARGRVQGGCGELDILENLQQGDHNKGISEIYSFKRTATGTGSDNWFPRPLGGRATYAVLFDVASDSIAIQHWSAWNFATASIPRAKINELLAAPAKVIPFK
jgi:hypothetical protein